MKVNTNYPWKRFWYPVGTTPDIGDEDFLVDPESDYGRYVHPSLLSTTQLSNRYCLLLLGEPGIGKSTELRLLSRSARDSPLCDRILEVDLSEYGEESSLINEVFKSEEFSAWLRGSEVLQLFLDGLDECRISVPSIGGLLVRQFRRHKTSLHRLKIRITSRAFDFPGTMKNALIDLLGEDQIDSFQLAPLRRSDVQIAAEAEGIDPNAFVMELRRTQSIPFATTPVTLAFLLDAFRLKNALPNSRSELYQMGCKRLCEELNQRQREISRYSTKRALSSDQRIVVASRIAAVIVFSGKAAVQTDVQRSALSMDNIPAAALVGWKEQYESDEFAISEHEIEETLGTALFSQRGGGLVTFSHRTYAEFLASRYLCLHGVTSSDVLAMLCSPSDPDRRVVPQLHGTAAWIAEWNADVRSHLIRTDPYTLLQSDLSTVGEETRHDIVEAVLSSLEDKSERPPQQNLYGCYGRLAHSGLSEQLSFWITDTTQREDTREAAIDIAEACGVRELQSLLAEIALDETLGTRLRGDASLALVTLGDAQTRSLLRPLALGHAGEDALDNLKGCALKAVWPELITADELFANLTPRKRRYFVGQYVDFVERALAESLPAEVLPPALCWIERQASKRRYELDFPRLADRIMVQAWQCMDDPSVFEPMVEASIKLFRNNHDLVGDDLLQKEFAVIFDDQRKRRKVACGIVERMLDPTLTFHLLRDWPNLLREGDFEFCLQKLLASISNPHEVSWARITWMLFPRDPTSDAVELMFDARSRSPKLRTVTDPAFRAIMLGSPEALERKKQAILLWETERDNESVPLNPPPKERVKQALAWCEADHNEDLWIVFREMTLEANSRQYGDSFSAEVMKLPGWTESDETTRERILDACERRLESLTPLDNERLYRLTADEKDVAVLKAFLALHIARPKVIDGLEVSVWNHWLPVLMGPFGPRKKADAHSCLLARAYSCITSQFIEFLIRLLRACLEGIDYTFLLDVVEQLWDERIRDAAFGLLHDAKGMPVFWGQLISVLVDHNDGPAIQLAIDLLVAALPHDKADWEIAKKAAQVLLKIAPDAGWSSVWPAIQSNHEFGRELLQSFAYEDRRGNSALVSKLEEHALGDLFIWMVTEYPYAEDPHHDGVFSPTPDDAVRDLRNALLNHLRSVGTHAACAALESVALRLPQERWLLGELADARRLARKLNWVPVGPMDILKLCAEPSCTLVRDAADLQRVLIGAINDMQVALQGETPAAPDLWDKLYQTGGKFRPKEEAAFSNWVKRQLDVELSKRGITIAREVQIRQGEGAGQGERTDLHVTAVVPGLARESFETVRVIIEAKGCWHRELGGAMKSQLVDRYLRDNSCQHGIYLIGWYHCEQWDDEDGRKQHNHERTVDEARAYFTMQAEDLSSGGLEIRAIVLNAALR